MEWLIYTLTFQKYCNTEDVKLIDKGLYLTHKNYFRLQIQKDLDITSLIRKHNEINKLKSIIFKED